MRRNYLLILFALLLLGGCKKDSEAFKSGIGEASPTFDVRVTSASISGMYGYRSDLKSVTVVYDKNSDFSSASTIPAEIHNCKDAYNYYYHVRLPDLEPGTTYYYYCIFDTGYGSAEGKQWSFTTQGNGGGGGGGTGDHAYVDLGLPSGLLWATCNVGANSPEDYGDYFAWGETEVKSTYNWSTYKWCNDGDYHKLTKYNTDSYYSYYGIVDNRTILELADDAARANWGGDWRMPTYGEMRELEDNCTSEWTTQNGVNGRKFTGTNGNSIFLPAAGYYGGGSLNDAGSYGYYWSSSLRTGCPVYAYYLYFDSGHVDVYSDYRNYGRSVRPVCPSQK